jgi:protein TonB
MTGFISSGAAPRASGDTSSNGLAADGLHTGHPGAVSAGSHRGLALACALLLHAAVLGWLLMSRHPVLFALSAAGRPVTGAGVQVTLVNAPVPVPPPPAPTPVVHPVVHPVTRPVVLRHAPVLASRVSNSTQQVAAEPVPLTAPPPSPLQRTPAPTAAAPTAPTAISPELNLLGAQAAKHVANVECHIPQPAYPARAKRLGEQGTVRLRITLDTAGRVAQVVVETSSGFDDLDTAALEAIRSGHCAPFIENGRAVSVVAVQPLTFNLEN